MVQHHPDDNFLTEFSAGSMDWGLALAVAAHLQFCQSCRTRVGRLNGLGGSLLAASPPVEPGDHSFGQVMARIKSQTANQPEQPPAKQRLPLTQCKHRESLLNNLPVVVRKLLPAGKKIKWRFVSSEFKLAQLNSGQHKYDVALHRIKTGGKAAQHDHTGIEVTLVLQGSFSDRDGVYTQGDFLVRGPGNIHRPVASQEGDCLCLTVLESPVTTTGFWGRFRYPMFTVRAR